MNTENQKKDDEVLLEQVRELKNQDANKVAVNDDKDNTAIYLHEPRRISPILDDKEAKRVIASYSRRDFLIGGAAAVFAGLGYYWLRQPENIDIFYKTFKFNESVSQTFYSPASLAPNFPRERVGELRVNGGEGMSEGFDVNSWRLQVTGIANPQQYQQFRENIAYDTAMDNHNEMMDTNQLHESKPDAKENPNKPKTPPMTMDRAASGQIPMSGLLLSLEDIKALPRTEMTTELKCIEGWSTIVNWTGARFSDFIAKYLPNTRNGSQSSLERANDLLRYVSLVTPDGGYYVGMDLPSILHPQTLLCYEMNGAPLTMEHGAPLRLVSTTKYGIKQIKRIGRIAFTDERPADFWNERGYDWYAGH